jgi:hypothetical protein
MHRRVYVRGLAPAYGGGVMNALHQRRWKLNMVLLVAGAATVFSGFLVQIHFHMHRTRGAVWGLDHAEWNLLHQLASFTFLCAMAWHLAMNWKSFLVCWSPRRTWRRMGFYLAVTFGLAVVTALWALSAFLLVGHGLLENTLVEIHDKVTIPLSVLLLVHGWQRRGRLFRRA